MDQALLTPDVRDQLIRDLCFILLRELCRVPWGVP